MGGQQPRSAHFHSVAAALVGVLIVAAIHVVLLYAARVQTSETPKLITEWNSEPANNVIYVMQPPPETYPIPSVDGPQTRRTVPPRL